MKTQKKLFEDISKRIIQKLEKGLIPWQRPWSNSAVLPQNLLTKKAYRGINLFLLSDFNLSLFLTPNQIKNIKGARLKTKETQPQILSDNQIVYNVEQITGIDHLLPKSNYKHNNQSLEKAETLIEESLALKKVRHIEFGGLQAFYHKGKDFVGVPYQERFVSPEKYYATIFHEAIHSTGHSNRLNRKGLMEFSAFGEDFSLEELTAEFGSAYLCALLGIDNQARFTNSAIYIKGWLKAVREDEKLIDLASTQSILAVEYLLKETSFQV